MSEDKTPTTIKIAAKDASQRTSAGQADPGPGDPEAEPSEMPEPVSIPAPPSPSELVIKSVKTAPGYKTVDSRNIKTINDPVSLPKSRLSTSKTHKTATMSKSSLPEGEAPRESTSSKVLASNRNASFNSYDPNRTNSKTPSVPGSQKTSVSKTASGPHSTTGASASAQESNQTGAMDGGTASQNMQADSQAGGQEHDVIDEGETEIDHSPSASPAAPDGNVSPGPISPGSSVGTSASPASAAAGTSKVSTKTSTKGSTKKGKKKTTKFRYHKRVTVRTHGKTSPSTVMDKVNMKDHKAGITPSTIGEMDTEELMKRAGIKPGTKAHWRVRLRQTKRTTKDGKTSVQTRVAYRDSEGNKRIKTSATPNCQKCGKKLEDCKCDES